MPDILKLGEHCRLEYNACFGVSIVYVERSQDYWYSNMDTEVDIDQAKAAEVIAWLQDKYPALVASRTENKG